MRHMTLTSGVQLSLGNSGDWIGPPAIVMGLNMSLRLKRIVEERGVESVAVNYEHFEEVRKRLKPVMVRETPEPDVPNGIVY